MTPYMSPWAEHVLDWFHVTMRITTMKQMAKGLISLEEFKDKDFEKDLDRIKWCLWHGNVFKALKVLDNILFDIDWMEDETESKKLRKFIKAVNEFRIYVHNNQEMIPNYGDRHHYGEAISSAFVESAINEVVSRRMVKKQQMRWTRPGAHNILQLRTKTLNNELRDIFKGWYPGMANVEDKESRLASVS